MRERVEGSAVTGIVRGRREGLQSQGRLVSERQAARWPRSCPSFGKDTQGRGSRLLWQAVKVKTADVWTKSTVFETIRSCISWTLTMRDFTSNVWSN